MILPAAIVAGYQFPLLIALVGRGRTHLGRQVGAAVRGQHAGRDRRFARRRIRPPAVALGARRLAIRGALARRAGARCRWRSSWRHARRADRSSRRSPPRCLRSAVSRGAPARPPSGVTAASAPAAPAPPSLHANQMREWARTHAARDRLGRGRHGEQRRAGHRAGRLHVHRQRQGRRQRPQRRRHAGDARAARGAAATPTRAAPWSSDSAPAARPAGSARCRRSSGSTSSSSSRSSSTSRGPATRSTATCCATRKCTSRSATRAKRCSRRATRYDLIASEPSNPFRAGVASLFTREYYQAARGRLTGDGLFLQWVQLYEIDARTLQTVYATIASVFPHVEAWEAGGSDLVLVAANEPLVHHAAVAGRADPGRTFQDRPECGVARRRSAGLPRALRRRRGSWRAIDRATRPAWRSTPTIAISSSSASRARWEPTNRCSSTCARWRAPAGRDRPAFADRVPLDWDAIQTAWVGYQADGCPSGWRRGHRAAGRTGPPDRAAPLLSRHRPAGAREAWRQHARPPIGPTELAMVADFDAESGSDAAPDAIDRAARLSRRARQTRFSPRCASARRDSTMRRRRWRRRS